MKQIELTQGQYALVDDDDFNDINRYSWYFHLGYAVRSVKISCEQKTQCMHRLITNCPADMDVDHANHNTLDNQKVNLRVCSRSENNQNQQVRTYAKTSIYKGVLFYKRDGKWQAKIALNGKQKHLGYFANEIDAAIAYNVAAIEMFGEFALLNNIK